MDLALCAALAINNTIYLLAIGILLYKIYKLVKVVEDERAANKMLRNIYKWR